MSRSTLIALLLGLLLIAAPVSRAHAEGDEYDDGEEEEATEDAGEAADTDVIVLTKDNFDETIKKHKFVLVEFYAPWCGHCKNLAPHYAKAATALKDYKDADVVLGKVDATQENELGTRFDIKGYPTLKWFVDGEHIEYNGPREADGIVSWIKKKTGPATTEVESADKLKELEAENPAIAVAYKVKGDDLETYKAVAQKVEDVLFIETSTEAVAAAAGIKKAGHIAMIKNFKGETRATEAFSGKLGQEEFSTWVAGEKIPLTLEFNEANSDKIFNSGIKKQLILWGSAADTAADSKVFQAYKKVATQFKGKLVFVVVDNEGSSHEPVTNFFGLKEAKGPLVVGFFMEESKKYKMADDVTESHLKKFAQGVIDGTAPVEYKSAPIPEDNKDGDVTVVVGKTVDDIVFDDKRDVLLEVYAPWCGHCKQLEPTWKKLAKRFKKVDSVVIAKMDGTENEHPQLEVRGFPTIFFVPAGSKEPISFDENDRSLKAFTKYIKKNAKIPYELPKKEGGGKDEAVSPDEGQSEAPAENLKDEL